MSFNTSILIVTLRDLEDHLNVISWFLKLGRPISKSIDLEHIISNIP